jgi:D-alanyl-lipoteichoic acid acyltransferase DltB (MBOAT superfamily)
MLFNSFHFVYFFLIVTTLFFVLPHNKRWMLLLAASCYFYMAFVPIYIVILGFTIVVDYFAGIYIEKAEGRRRRNYLIVSLVANIGVLCVFKYYNFFNENLSFLMKGFGLDNPIPYLSILLPIGLSFHTFQAMSYTIEVYRGNQKAEKHFGIYSLYVMFYPQLVAGPIERPQNLLHQFRQKMTLDHDRIFAGLKMMAWGFFKKLVVADRVGVFVDAAYYDVDAHGGMTFVATTLLFSFQIYCDFSGYTDIAIGAAKVMGFDLMKNFNQPVFAKSTGEFWKRWHISLSTWFKDYLFFPLGGSKGSNLMRYRNLMIVFVISGFWHGANWTYVIWGAINGFYLVFALVTKNIRNKFNQAIGIVRFPKLHLAIQVIVTFILISISRIFFRSKSVEEACKVFKKMMTFSGNVFEFGKATFFYPLAAVTFLTIVEFRREYFQERFSLTHHTNYWVRSLYMAFLLAAIVLFGVFNGQQFIYFQF